MINFKKDKDNKQASVNIDLSPGESATKLKLFQLHNIETDKTCLVWANDSTEAMLLAQSSFTDPKRKWEYKGLINIDTKTPNIMFSTDNGVEYIFEKYLDSFMNLWDQATKDDGEDPSKDSRDSNKDSKPAKPVTFQPMSQKIVATPNRTVSWVVKECSHRDMQVYTENDAINILGYNPSNFLEPDRRIVIRTTDGKGELCEYMVNWNGDVYMSELGKWTELSMLSQYHIPTTLIGWIFVSTIVKDEELPVSAEKYKNLLKDYVNTFWLDDTFVYCYFAYVHSTNY